MVISLGISFKVEGAGPTAWLERAKKRVDAQVDDILKTAAEAGRDQMQINVGLRRERQSGDMQDEIYTDSRGSNQYSRKARFGWLKKQEDYFLYQEEGFWHWSAGRSIGGAFAMADAFDEARDLADSELRRIGKA